MAESTLSLTYNGLVESACLEAGYPLSSGDRSTAQNAMIERALAAGLRRAYFPGSVTLKSGRLIEPFKWSWMANLLATSYLWPTFEPSEDRKLDSSGAAALAADEDTVWYDTMVGKAIVLYVDDDTETVSMTRTVVSVSGSTLTVDSAVTAGKYRWGMVADGDYRMIDAFGGLLGGITLDTPAGVNIGSVAPYIIRQNRQAQEDLTGMPTMVTAIPELQSSGAVPQRWLMQVWPIPDTLYLARYRMAILRDALSAVLLYPAGGMPYSEVFRTAVVAAINSIANDGANPMREGEYADALAAAAMHDQATSRPDNYGGLRGCAGMSRHEMRSEFPRPASFPDWES